MSEDNNREEKEKLRKFLATCTPEEKELLRKRLNLNPDNQNSLDQIGRDFNVTKKRIQEIEKKALKKLKDYLPDDVA